VQKTIAMLALGDTVRSTVGESFPLVYVDDTPYAMQLALNTMRPPVSFGAAASLLRGDTAAFAVVGDAERLRRKVGDGSAVFEVASVMHDGRPFITIVGNRPRLAWEDTLATRVGPLVVTLRHVGLGAAWDATVGVSPRDADGSAVIKNASAVPQRVRVRPGRRPEVSRMLEPSETWQVEVGRSADAGTSAASPADSPGRG
jgi:hypothetical protein